MFQEELNHTRHPASYSSGATPLCHQTNGQDVENVRVCVCVCVCVLARATYGRISLAKWGHLGRSSQHQRVSAGFGVTHLTAAYRQHPARALAAAAAPPPSVLQDTLPPLMFSFLISPVRENVCMSVSPTSSCASCQINKYHQPGKQICQLAPQLAAASGL